MNFSATTVYRHDELVIESLLPEIGEEQVISALLSGLTAERKSIPCLFFYDEKGSKLFEEITELEEYYPTRIEKALLVETALQMNLRGLHIIELGSGDLSKISLLLGGLSTGDLATIRYTPVDISLPALKDAAHGLIERFPQIRVTPIVADFCHQLHLIPKSDRHLFCFLGSTIGNFSSEQARGFFRAIGDIMHPGDTLLLGVDLVKEVKILEAAYNDSKQVTAQFNRNILNNVNRLLGTNFEPGRFRHLAVYNEEASRIEMYLIAEEDMRIRNPHSKDDIRIQKGERIHTEHSHKFTPDAVAAMAGLGGLRVLNTATDEKNWYSLVTLLKT